MKNKNVKECAVLAKNDEKWGEAIALSTLASNYSTVYDVWCKDMISHRMKMRMKDSYKNHLKEHAKKND